MDEHRAWGWMVVFQSTLAITGERAAMGAFEAPTTVSFQSTLAIAGERAVARLAARTATRAVSIHARHCWRASRRKGTEGTGGQAVSIHARHCWRASPDPADPQQWDEDEFQSTLAIAGERAL